MKSSLGTIIFAVVMGLVCALLLTGAAEFVKPRREANEKAERYRNILQIFNIRVSADAGNKEIIDAFDKNVQIIGESDKPDYYQYTISTDGVEQVYLALPLAGPGLWGPMEGLIGLAPDGTTVTAVSFYKQEETPGLGGEIAGQEFTDRFIDQKLFDEQGTPALKLVKPGTASGYYEIDAISGATLTSEKVQSIISNAGGKFRKLRQKE